MNNPTSVVYSHPPDDAGDDYAGTVSDGVHLNDHLTTVGERVSEFVSCVDLDTMALSTLGHIVGELHDFTKATPELQRYLRTSDNSTHHSHSPSSATVTAAVLDYIGASPEEVLLGFMAVDRHHSALSDDRPPQHIYRSYVRQPDQSDKDPGYNEHVQHVNSIDSDEAASEFAQMHLDSLSDRIPELTTSVSWEEIHQAIISGDVGRTLHKATRDETGSTTGDAHISETYYPRLLQVWSALGRADIVHAAAPELDAESYPRPTRQAVTERVKQLTAPKKSNLNELREDARREVVQNVASTDWESTDVGMLPLPTGLGKTLTGTQAALEILDRTSTTDDTGRYTSDGRTVVYALPYTSIIDQTAEEFDENLFPDADQSEDLFTIHHHLNDTRVKPSDTMEAVDDRLERHLGESWHSGTVLTTFVQLFESFLGPNRTSATKLPSLRNSVIILDEPQAIPHDWWPLIQRLATVLAHEYDAKILSMTATHPNILAQSDELETTTLLDDPGHYATHDAVQRVSYKFHESVFDDADTYDYRSVADDLLNAADGGESTLAICNTIDSARHLTHVVTDEQNAPLANPLLEDWYRSSGGFDGFADVVDSALDEDQAVVIHLSSRHRMKDRRMLLSYAHETDRQVILVSTQVVEAGVDISFDRVVRDFAPIQSIVQAAGRCNRNAEADECRPVQVVRLSAVNDEADTTPGEAVYSRGANLLKDTRKAIESVGVSAGDGTEWTTVQQATVAQGVVDEYYDRLRGRNVGQQEYVRHVDQCRFEALADLSMIDTGKTADFVVTANADEEASVERIRETAEYGGVGAAVRQLKQINELQVSIPVYGDEDEIRLQSAEPLASELNHRTVQAKTGDSDAFYTFTDGISIPSSTVQNRIL